MSGTGLILSILVEVKLIVQLIKRKTKRSLVFLLIVASLLCMAISQPIKGSGDTWIERAPMPNSHVYLSATPIEGRIFVVGTNYTVDSNSNMMYDPSADSWTIKAPMRVYRGAFAVASLQGNIYVIGGFTGITPQLTQQATAVNEMFDPETNSWTNKASLPEAQGFLQAVSVSGKIYAMGGATYNGTNYDIESSNQAYDPASDSWQPLSPIPNPVYNFALTAVGSKIFVMGGTGPEQNGITTYSNQTQIYDTQTNTWTFGRPLPITTFSSGAVATEGVLAPVKIYLIGATDELIWAQTNTGPCPTQIYNPRTDSWSSGTSIPTPRESGFAMAALNDTVYVIGGYDGTIQSKVNEQYFPVGSNESSPSPSEKPTSTPTLTPSPTAELDITAISIIVIVAVIVIIVIVVFAKGKIAKK